MPAVAGFGALPQYPGMGALLPVLTTALFALAAPAGDDVTVEEVQAVLASPLGQVASQLVRVSRGDEFFLNSFRDISRQLRKDGRITDAQLACMEEIKREDYTPVLAVALISEYDQPVLENALGFYTAPIGARFMRMVYEKNWRVSHTDFPLPPERARESMTLTELGQVMAFKESPLTGEFADPRMITQWKQTRDAGALLARVKMLTCHIPNEALPDNLRLREKR